MSDFKILKTDGNARRGKLITSHGEINTPAFMPVGTQATVKGVFIDDIIKTISTNYNLPSNDKFYFSSAIIDLKTQNFIAKDTLIEVHNDIFGNIKNNPRLKSVSSNKDGNITTLKKGIFTSCKKNDGCPPWTIQADKITYDQNKKQINYE